MSPDMPRSRDADAIAATESWFVRRGLPHFIFRYRASRNVWTRAAPLLTLIALVEVVANAPNADFPVWVSVLVSVAAFLAVVGVWAAANRLRHRPAFARPVDVGPVEVAMFVIVPALVPMAAGGQVRSGLVTGAANLAFLCVIYVTTSYGIAPMTRWAVGHGARQIRAVSGLIVRALPLLLLVVIVVFYTVEPFQIARELPWPLIGLAVGLFFLVGLLFAVIRVPRQVDELSEHESWPTLRARAKQTPAAPLLASIGPRPPAVPRLSRKEWMNVGLVVLASEAILIVLVGSAMFAFLVVLGVLTIPADLARFWIGAKPDVLLSFSLFDTRLVVTTELLKASTFLAGFSALQFTVSLLSDGTYQEEFLHQLRESLRESLAGRAVYLTVMIRRSRRATR